MLSINSNIRPANANSVVHSKHCPNHVDNKPKPAARKSSSVAGGVSLRDAATPDGWKL